MDAEEGASGDAGQLVLTPSKLRVHSAVVTTYATGTWLMHAVFILLLLLQVEGVVRLPWWALFGPEWLVHAVQVPLYCTVIASRGAMVEQQLGPAPGPRASAGLIVQYSSMRSTRLRTLAVDNACGLLESLALLAFKVLLVLSLEAGAVAAGTVCWRAVFAPLWVLWPLTTAAAWLKAPSERMMGGVVDLMCLTAVFVALRLDGVVAYSWKVVFMVPWMWFGAIFLAALAALAFSAAACSACAREATMPLGVLALLVSAGAQLPGWIALAHTLDGDAATTAAEVLVPMAAGWLGMWLSGLAIAAGLSWKERLRASLAAAGRTWTADDATHRRVMRSDLRETQRQVDRMSDAQLARVTHKLMRHKERPEALLRVGETLWRRAAEATAASGVIQDGVAPLVGPRKGGGAGAGALPGDPQPPPVQLARLHGRCSGTQEEVCCVSAAASAACPPAKGEVVIALTDPTPADAEPGTVTVEIVVRAGGPPAPPPPPCALYTSAGVEHGGMAALGRAVGGDGDGCVRTAALEEGAAAVAAATALPPVCRPLASQEQQQQQQQQFPQQLRQPLAQVRSPTPEDGLCTICCDRRATCVFMECGHGGYCWRCAHLLYVRPPNECPACRARIELVLEVTNPAVPLGGAAPVLPARARAAAAAAPPPPPPPAAATTLLGCLPCTTGGGAAQAVVVAGAR